MKSEFEKQAQFLARKLRECVMEELEVALQKGELKHIKGEQISKVADIVYWYYAEYNKPYGGGYMRASINTIISDALTAFYDAKTGKLREPDYNLERAWRQLLVETTRAFEERVKGIEIELDGRKIEDFDNKYEIQDDFVKNPIYQFGMLGNDGPFCVGRENEQGLPVRKQYFSKNGKILDEPITTYYVDGAWRNAPTAKHY